MRPILVLTLLPSVLGGSQPATATLCPADMVLVRATKTCMDRFEWPNRAGERPLLGVTAVRSSEDQRRGVTMDAESLCASVGKRMCRLEEWVPACRGRGGTDYPFGRKLPKKKPPADEAPCNYAQQFLKPDERKVWGRDPGEMARLDQSDPSGARGCVSGSGAEDMMGNAEEWIRCPAWMSSQCVKEAGKKTCYCLAGRYWSDPAPCTKVIAGHAPDWHYYESGTRCCSDLHADGHNR